MIAKVQQRQARGRSAEAAERNRPNRSSIASSAPGSPIGKGANSKPIKIADAKPSWLSLERACFGFESERDGEHFSFDPLFAWLTKARNLQNDDGISFKLAFNRKRISLTDKNTGETKADLSIDEIIHWGNDLQGGDLYTRFALSIERMVFVQSAVKSLIEHLFHAIEDRFARVFARVDNLHSDFSELPPDVFRYASVRSFRRGYAETPDGKRLFSLHIEPSRPKPTLSRQAGLPALFEQFLRSKYRGDWPNLKEKQLAYEFLEWCKDKNPTQKTISHSTFCRIKSQYSKDFFVSSTDPDKIGQASDIGLSDRS